MVEELTPKSWPRTSTQVLWNSSAHIFSLSVFFIYTHTQTCNIFIYVYIIFNIYSVFILYGGRKKMA